jgi:hypothetical protein
MLGHEGKLLHTLQRGNCNTEDMDNYAIKLSEFLDRKESLLWALQSKLDEFQHLLAKEQELAQKVTRLTQY